MAGESAAFAGGFGKQIDLAILPVHFIGGRKRVFLRDDDRPKLGILAVELDPFLHVRFGVGSDRIRRAFGLADAAVNAFVWMNDEHVLAFIETVHRADFDAVGVFASDAGVIHDIGHGYVSISSICDLANSAARIIQGGAP